MKRQPVLRTLIGAFAIATVAGICGCAKSPESIPPAYVSHQPYMDWTCGQLSDELQRLHAAYTSAAAQQTQARTEDTFGVILLGLPVASLSGGNVAPQIASLKGNIRAVEQAMSFNDCERNVSPESIVAPQPSPPPQPMSGSALTGAERHALLSRSRDMLHHLPPVY